MTSHTLKDFMHYLAHDDFLGDTNYRAGAQTWVDTVCEDFGPSAGGLVAAAKGAGYLRHTNSDVLELTEGGATEIARIRTTEG